MMEHVQPARLSKITVAFGISAFVSMLVFGHRYPIVAQQFRDLFEGFGADLPDLAEFLVGKAKTVSAVLLLFACIEFFLVLIYFVKRTSTTRHLVWLSVLLNVLIVIAVVVGFYFPIFKLGSVV